MQHFLRGQPAKFVVNERQQLFGGGGISLKDTIESLHKVRDDKDVRGVLITLTGTSFNLAQAQEMREALLEIRRAGKDTFVYADAYDTIAYTFASVASNICMLEGGEIEIPGVGMETMFLKGTLDLLLEIRRTGDIFFPQRWTESTLSGHRSAEAAETVRRFLAGNPGYPERLRWTILSGADELFRAAGTSG